MSPRRMATRNAGNNSSSDTPLETLVANVVNSAISGLIPNLVTQIQQMQQNNNGGNNKWGNNGGNNSGGNNNGGNNNDAVHALRLSIFFLIYLQNQLEENQMYPFQILEAIDVIKVSQNPNRVPHENTLPNLSQSRHSARIFYRRRYTVTHHQTPAPFGCDNPPLHHCLDTESLFYHTTHLKLSIFTTQVATSFCVCSYASFSLIRTH
ncbi:hypothetical protein L1987_26201 [Smallanthus sonchifolius]|uniref:Uncharacterized protein n=1 Tax=Smallanthus sonchifolius TaxID=185202 RepID=A0ACB9I904_9ASTR|nr:hypothetical protein L1987_26201 [Smallanthus sonchifolius]